MLRFQSFTVSCHKWVTHQVVRKPVTPPPLQDPAPGAMVVLSVCYRYEKLILIKGFKQVSDTFLWRNLNSQCVWRIDLWWTRQKQKSWGTTNGKGKREERKGDNTLRRWVKGKMIPTAETDQGSTREKNSGTQYGFSHLGMERKGSETSPEKCRTFIHLPPGHANEVTTPVLLFIGFKFPTLSSLESFTISIL